MQQETQIHNWETADHSEMDNTKRESQRLDLADLAADRGSRSFSRTPEHEAAHWRLNPGSLLNRLSCHKKNEHSLF